MPKLLTLTFVIVGSAAICPHPVMALRFSAPTPKFNYTDAAGKKQSVDVVDKYYPKKIVQPIAKDDAQIDPKLRRAATIAEERILPLAQERGVAVIANRPFGSGDLFGKVRSKPLPDWAAEFDCRSWAQFFLKWIVANRAITCAIPATDKPRHLEDNMQGGIDRLPDAKLRRRMAELVSSL